MTLRWRLRISGVTAGLGVILALLLTGGPVLWSASRRLARVFAAVPAHELARCDAAPHQWRYDSGTGLVAWALDEATFAPRNPAAEPLPSFVVARLWAGEAQPVVVNPLYGGLMVLRRPEPCGLVVLTWPIDTVVRRPLAGIVAVAVALALASAGLFSGWLVLRPLLASLRALDVASRAVGSDGYSSAAVDPEMDAVRDALDEAHARVIAERSRLLDEQRSLERHIADVSHDLRSPLAALQLRLERIAATPGDLPAIQGALADVAYLGLLTDNLATSGQLRHGLLPVEGTTDLAGIAPRVADRFRQLALSRDIDLVCAVPDGPVEVPGPGLYIEQIVSNLVHNAIRHHDGSGTVVIQVEPTPFLEVSDDGPGRVADLPTTRPEPGQSLGLGLSIVRQLAAHLTAQVELVDGTPRGLVIRVSWPPRNRDISE